MVHKSTLYSININKSTLQILINIILQKLKYTHLDASYMHLHKYWLDLKLTVKFLSVGSGFIGYFNFLQTFLYFQKIL